MKLTKRLLSVLLATMLIITSIAMTQVSAASSNKVTAILGDVDGNKRITIKDATLLQKAISGSVELDPLSCKIADIDGNGKTTVKDVSAIQKWLSGKKVSYGIGKSVTFNATTIQITVTDTDTGKSVGNALYGLYSDKACTKLLETAASTTASETTSFANLYVDGKYYIKQLSSPDNYAADTTIYQLSVNTASAGSNVVQAKIKQAPKSIFIQNYDAADTRPWMYLEGGIFGVYSDKACKVLVDKVTDQYSDDVFVAGKTYYVKQLKAPDGYRLNSTAVKITIPTNPYTRLVSVQIINYK